jgi:hypothetical protein
MEYQWKARFHGHRSGVSGLMNTFCSKMRHVYNLIICPNFFDSLRLTTFLNKGELTLSCRKPYQHISKDTSCRKPYQHISKDTSQMIPGNDLNSIWASVVTKLCVFSLFTALDSKEEEPPNTQECYELHIKTWDSLCINWRNKFLRWYFLIKLCKEVGPIRHAPNINVLFFFFSFFLDRNESLY